MHRCGAVAVAIRTLRVSSTFRQSVARLGVLVGSPAHRAVSATMRALSASDLPGGGDFETSFSPGKAYVRGAWPDTTLWVSVYRFSDQYVYAMTARGQPPVPVDA